MKEFNYIEKTTWRRFISEYDFSNWKFNDFPINELCIEVDNKYIIRQYKTKHILRHPKIKVDFKKHIVDSKKIVDWEIEYNFYLIFEWNDEKKDFIPWKKAYLTYQDAINN